MLRYALMRVIGAIPTLMLVIVVAFMMVRAAPGGPFDRERVLPPEIEENIRRAYHLDEPLPQQFVRYVEGGHDLESASGQTHHMLPVPSTFVIGRDGLIHFQYANPDYKVRLGDVAIAGTRRAMPAAWKHLMPDCRRSCKRSVPTTCSCSPPTTATTPLTPAPTTPGSMFPSW